MPVDISRHWFASAQADELPAALILEQRVRLLKQAAFDDCYQLIQTSAPDLLESLVGTIKLYFDDMTRLDQAFLTK